MIKKIELYKGKYIDVDTDKVKEYIFNFFCALLVSLFILLPEHQFFPNTITIKTAYILVISFLFGISYIGLKIYEKQFKFNIYGILIIVYVVLLILSCVFSDYKYNVLFANESRNEGLLSLIAYLITFYIFKKLFKYNEKIFDLLTISVVLISCYGIIQGLVGRFYGLSYGVGVYRHEYMAYGTMTNPNMFSSFLTLFLPIYIVKYLNGKENIYLIISAIIFGALICTKTFGGYITFFIYFIVLTIYFFAISKEKKNTLLKIFAIMGVFVLTFVILNIVNDNVYMDEFVRSYGNNTNKEDVIDTNTNSNNIEKFGNNRGYIWKITLEIIKEHPLLGVGPDCLKHEIYDNYYGNEDYLFKETIIDKAHNEYLQIAVTTGVPSLIVYIVLIMLILFRLLFKYINIVKTKGANSKEAIFIVAITASLVAYLFQAAANISITSVAPLFWAMLGIGANISEKETQNS